MIGDINWQQLTFLIIFILTISALPLPRIWMNKTIRDALNMKIWRKFSGPKSALALNRESRKVAYAETFWTKAIILSPSDLVFKDELSYIIEDTRQQNVKGVIGPIIHTALHGNYLLTIFTSVESHSVLRLAFLSLGDAQRCILSILDFLDLPKYDPDKKVRKEKLIKALKERLPDSGKPKKQIGKRKLQGHIKFLKENMEHICGRPLRHGDNQVIAAALFTLFGQTKDDPPDSGYTLSSLISGISKCKD